LDLVFAIPRISPVKFAVTVVAVEVLILVAWHFPSATDREVDREAAVRDYYATMYSPSHEVVRESEYTKAASNAARTVDIVGEVKRFVDAYGLRSAKVLDVGSGGGYLQDVVEDYTGIDIAPAAARFYHKRFVAGTATAMPFADAEFDVVWSIWVLEHIPNPEAALSEIRRVVRPGGLIYLRPAWDVKPWAADGYEARPYGDLDVLGRVIKASILFRNTLSFWLVTTIPNRLIRAPASLFGPTRFHYRRLTPNYREYWQADSDAVNDLDSAETAMWFQSRGDECLNCWPGWQEYLQVDMPLIIRVSPHSF
jgi:SAM-dependent methyltransferase